MAGQITQRKTSASGWTRRQPLAFRPRSDAGPCWMNRHPGFSLPAQEWYIFMRTFVTDQVRRKKVSENNLGVTQWRSESFSNFPA